MEIRVQISLSSTFYFFFLFSVTFSSYTLILPVSQLIQTQQQQIRSHREYLTETHIILVLILYSKLMKNLALLTIFNAI